MITRASTVALLLLVAAPSLAEEFPDKYVLDYPAAEAFCPPVRSTFYEARSTFSVVKGRRFRHLPNGGYGLPVVAKQDGKNLLHVGADLGWHQVGEPVFAVANGVVRISRGPQTGIKNETDEEGAQEEDKEKRRRADSSAKGRLEWGNLIVIEHRSDQGEFVTTLYGHLDTKRLVQPGDIVQAGQQIGTIGRRQVNVNGNYTPHLHFGVREGRAAEPGRVLLPTTPDGSRGIVLTKAGEEQIELQLPDGMHAPVTLRLGEQDYRINNVDGKAVAPASWLWHYTPASFAVVGYALTTEGWLDPIQFLRDQGADTNPAAYQPSQDH